MADVAAFLAAVERGELDAVRAMLTASHDLVRARDGTGGTALHVAAFHGRRAVAELLLDAGAELNARDDTFGATPAGWAIEYLRERGALLATEIEDGLFAIRRGDAELLARLVERHPALASAVDRSGTSLVAHAARAPDPSIGRALARGEGA